MTLTATALPSVVSYNILHQAQDGSDPGAYVSRLRALHGRVAEAAREAGAARERGQRTVLTREAEVLRGALNPFLETPLRTDEAEIHRILSESLDRLTGKIHPFPRLRGSTEGRISVAAVGATVHAHQPGDGGAYLRQLGFGGGPGAIFESLFVVDGGAGLDLLEHIVRDRLGIYDEPHGTHITQFAAVLFSAYNLIFSTGRENAETPMELCFHMSKPQALRYDEYRAGLTGAVEAALGSGEAVAGALWQRKLGLGSGREFIARIRCGGLQAAEKAADAFLCHPGAFPRGTAPELSPIPLLREIIL